MAYATWTKQGPDKLNINIIENMLYLELQEYETPTQKKIKKKPFKHNPENIAFRVKLSYWVSFHNKVDLTEV